MSLIPDTMYTPHIDKGYVECAVEKHRNPCDEWQDSGTEGAYLIVYVRYANGSVESKLYLPTGNTELFKTKKGAIAQTMVLLGKQKAMLRTKVLIIEKQIEHLGLEL